MTRYERFWRERRTLLVRASLVQEIQRFRLWALKKAIDSHQQQAQT
jgi:hypothetical protein